MGKPTNTRQRVLAYLTSYKDMHGFSPTMAEIAEHIGVSTTSIFYHLRKLEDAGTIEVERTQRGFARHGRMNIR